MKLVSSSSADHSENSDDSRNMCILDHGHLFRGDPDEAPGVMAVLPAPDIAHANRGGAGVAWRSRVAAGGRLHRGRGGTTWHGGAAAWRVQHDGANTDVKLSLCALH
jgi:hypothetical protein